jgi:hypothetical protein
MDIRDKLIMTRRLYRDYVAQIDECETFDPVMFKHYREQDVLIPYGRYDFMYVRPDLNVDEIRLSDLVKEAIDEIARLDSLIQENANIVYMPTDDAYLRTDIDTYLHKLRMEIARREQMRK